MPARGLIYDRNGALLADNVSAYRLELIPEQVEDIDLALEKLGAFINITPDDLKRFQRARDNSRRFLPITVKLRLDEQEVARFAVNRHRFPGVEVVPYLTRRYLHGDLFAHVIGYVARLDAEDLKAMGDERYSVLSHTGKTGIERAYEERLRGTIGYEEIETNARGRSLGVLKRHVSQAGTDLRLSLDLALQQATAEAQAIGLDELLLDDGVAIVEWAERIEPLLPPDHLRITLTVLDDTRRELIFAPHGLRAAELARRIVNW